MTSCYRTNSRPMQNSGMSLISIFSFYFYFYFFFVGRASGREAWPFASSADGPTWINPMSLSPVGGARQWALLDWTRDRCSILGPTLDPAMASIVCCSGKALPLGITRGSLTTPATKQWRPACHCARGPHVPRTCAAPSHCYGSRGKDSSPAEPTDRNTVHKAEFHGTTSWPWPTQRDHPDRAEYSQRSCRPSLSASSLPSSQERIKEPPTPDRNPTLPPTSREST